MIQQIFELSLAEKLHLFDHARPTVLASATARLAAVVPLPPTLDQTVTAAPTVPQPLPSARTSANEVHHQSLLRLPIRDPAASLLGGKCGCRVCICAVNEDMHACLSAMHAYTCHSMYWPSALRAGKQERPLTYAQVRPPPQPPTLPPVSRAAAKETSVSQPTSAPPPSPTAAIMPNAAPKQQAPPAKAPSPGCRRRSLAAETPQAAIADANPRRTLQQATGKAPGTGTPPMRPKPAATPATPAAGAPAATSTPVPTASISAIAARAPPQLVSLMPKVPPLPNLSAGLPPAVATPGQAPPQPPVTPQPLATPTTAGLTPAPAAPLPAALEPIPTGVTLLQVGENIMNECVDGIAPLPLGRDATNLRPFGGGQTWRHLCLNRVPS